MRGKLTLLAGVGVGYVLGTRAGRERYEQLAANAKKVWRDPRVQDKAGQAKHLAQEKAHDAGQTLKEKVTSSEHTGHAGQPDPVVTTPRPL